MNLKPFRSLAALGWVPPKNAPPRITLSRSGGLLRARTIQGGGLVLRWAPDDGDDFGPRSMLCRAFRLAAAGVNDGDVASTSSGIRIAAADYSAKIAATEDLAVEAVPDGGVVLSPDDVARLSWVTRTMAGADNRYNLNGWHVDERDGHPTAVTTDGNRMNYARIDALAGVGLPAKCIFGCDWWRAAETLAGKGGMRILVDGNTAWAAGDGWAVRGRLGEADFPDYHAVIPAAYGDETRVDVALLLASLRRVDHLAGTILHHTVTVAMLEQVLVMTAGGDRGLDTSVTTTTPVVSTGWATKGINARFLMETIRGVSGEVVIREAVGKNVSLLPLTVEIGDGRKAIIMPVRID